MADIRELQTDNFTIKSGHLDVGGGHKIYYEQWGDPNATVPILSFHGGPGSNYKASHKNLYNPHVHQVIFFDQRGCGNSLPYGKLENNTTDDILSDAVKILEHLGIKQVYTTGGSWGSTLATLFTIRYPKKTKATIVGGIFTGTKHEIEYVDKGYFKNFYPEVWERFVASVPESYQDNPAAYHYDKIANGAKIEITTSAKAFAELEIPLLQFDWQGYGQTIPDKKPDEGETYDNVPYQIYAHYFSQRCFLPEGYILKESANIKTPFAIVQGRYDMVCPPKTAFELHRAIPHSKLYITLGSHGASDPENRSVKRALVDTMFV